MNSRIAVVALSVACLFLAALLWHQHTTVEDLSRRQPTYRSDEAFISAAIPIWARKVKEAPATVMRNRYPVTVHFKDEVCVELRLKKGSVGGSPTYCFDKESLRPTRVFDDVE